MLFQVLNFKMFNVAELISRLKMDCFYFHMKKSRMIFWHCGHTCAISQKQLIDPAIDQMTYHRAIERVINQKGLEAAKSSLQPPLGLPKGPGGLMRPPAPFGAGHKAEPVARLQPAVGLRRGETAACSCLPSSVPGEARPCCQGRSSPGGGELLPGWKPGNNWP